MTKRTKTGSAGKATAPVVPAPQPTASTTPATDRVKKKSTPGATRRRYHRDKLAGKIAAPPDLSPREQLFVRAYIATNFNARKAAAEAGYTGTPAGVAVTAQRIMKRPRISMAIAAEIEAIASRKKIDLRAERVVQELANLGFSNALDYVKLKDDGTGRIVPEIDFANVGRAEGAAISEIHNEIVRTTRMGGEEDGDPGIEQTVSKVKFKLANKESALVQLARHLQITGFVDQSKANNLNIQFQVNLQDVKQRLTSKLIGSGTPVAVAEEEYNPQSEPIDGEYEDTEGGDGGE